MRALALPAFLEKFYNAGVWSDFDHMVDGDAFNILDADSGATVVHDADYVGGGVVLTTGTTDNNECALFSNELFKFIADRPILFGARASWAEANTDDLNIAIGLMDGVAANAMLDNGAGMKASFSGAVIYKKDGDTLWSVRSSIGSTYTDTETQHASNGGGNQTFAIQVMPKTSTEIDIVFWHDGQGGSNLQPMLDARGNVIKHTVTLGSPTEMAAAVYAKCGSTSSEVITVDFLGADQVRF